MSATLATAAPRSPSYFGQTSRFQQVCVGLLEQERVGSVGDTADVRYELVQRRIALIFMHFPNLGLEK